MKTTWAIFATLAIGCLAACALPARALAQAADPSPEENRPEAAEKHDAGSESLLTTRQRQVGERFRDLEKLLLRMAELTAPTDPHRAALLRQAVAQSKQRDIDHQFDELVELLRQERMSSVVKSQGELRDDLGRLLELLLSEDRGKRIESEKERIREYLKRVNKIIREQKSIQSETAREAEMRKLADRQGELADKTGEIVKQLEQDSGKESSDKKSDEKRDAEEGKPDKDSSPDKQNPDDKDSADKPSDGQKGDKDAAEKNDAKKNDTDKEKDAEKKEGEKKGDADKKDSEKKESEKKDSEKKDQSPDDEGVPPADQPPGDSQDTEAEGGQGQADRQSPAQKRLKQAEQRMKEAQQKLDEAQRAEAKEKQAEALKELEQAKADLEEILRQLREEEMSRTLAMLESRFRKMLDEQVAVYEGTKRLDIVAEAQRDRDDEIEAGRLSRRESQIALEADKALSVLHEEGSATAFPEAVGQMREDMQQVVERLAQAKVGEVTQGIEKDIITALEEMIASLEKAKKKIDDKTKPGDPAAGEDDEAPLVDTISELKMIRALQMRVNVRTQRYAEMTQTEQTDKPELLDALKRLAEREQRIHQVTRDIVVGRNR